MEKLLRRVLGEDLELEIRQGSELWPVRCDPGQVEQVILNLAVNARDAMPGGGRLEIGAGNAELDAAFARRRLGVRPGRYVELSVRDNGHGMEPAVLDHLFEPFFTTKERGKGTGLGLSTVYSIVHQSGGHIEVASQVGKGTLFRIYLPAHFAADSGAADDGDDEAGHGARALGGSETILLAEDEPAVRRLLADCLRAQGYSVVEAGDGAEALATASQCGRRIDLLLADLVMPKMGGAELAGRLADRIPGLKVVYMSGYADRSAALSGDGTPAPGAAFLQKPFATDVLVRKVREALDEAPGNT